MDCHYVLANLSMLSLGVPTVTLLLSTVSVFSFAALYLLLRNYILYAYCNYYCYYCCWCSTYYSTFYYFITFPNSRCLIAYLLKPCRPFTVSDGTIFTTLRYLSLMIAGALHHQFDLFLFYVAGILIWLHFSDAPFTFNFIFNSYHVYSNSISSQSRHPISSCQRSVY